MPKDNRDPALLGESLLELGEDTGGWLSGQYDAYRLALEACPDYEDETTLEKYGRPQDLPSTLP